MSRWLLTGGAGYIGSHVLRQMLDLGYDMVVVDDLSSGLRDRVPAGVPFVECSVADTARLTDAMKEHDVIGVIHFAAKKAVGESVERPLFYYEENIGGLVSLLQAMEDADVPRIVYSSSAAVYGEPGSGHVAEDRVLVPTSPYGETKVAGEWLVRAFARSGELTGEPRSFVLLRYFNVAGAGSDDLGDTSVANLIPMVLRAVTTGKRPQIFGSDYDTPDGTCVRDYIHVVDLADAHVSAVRACDDRPLGDAQLAVNVGRGEGSSVREVMDVVSQVIGFDVNAQEVDRRPGDPAVLVADAQLIRQEMDWQASYDLQDMVTSAWSAFDKPEGFSPK